MKKLIPVALIAVLSGVQLVSVAQTTQGHEHQVTPQAGAADMNAACEEMHNKMAAAKTDAERDQLMAEQHKKMQGRHAQMHAQMGSHGHGSEHGSRKGMPGASPEMHKRMQSMRDQKAQ